MDCPWRRTLASVFLLLSLHRALVLSQNVVPAGPLPPLNFARDTLSDYTGHAPGPPIQQMNFMPFPPNGPPPEFVPLIPCAPQFIGAEFPATAPLFHQTLSLNPTTQSNIDYINQAPLVNTQPITNLPPFQGPVFNPPPNNLQFPPGPPLNIPLTPLVPTPLLPFPIVPPNQNFSPITNVPQVQGPMPNIVPVPLVPISQIPPCNVPPVANLPPAQGPVFNIPQVPLGPIQGQYLNGPQLPLVPITAGPPCLPPANTGLQNQNIQMFPLLPTPLPQPNYVPPVHGQIPYPIPPEPIPIPLQYLAPPILPQIPQNYIPIPPPGIQQVPYPQQIVPLDCFPMMPIVGGLGMPPGIIPWTNYQIADLPPVLPALTAAPLCNNGCDNSLLAVDEYSPVPINLEINVPSPTMPEPKITVITAFTSPPATPAPVVTGDGSDVLGIYPSLPLPPLPPIIIESGRRSRSRSWLPLVLIALFARDGYCDGGGGGGGCCCCPCNSGNDIPIPYPIPIPTNNPIILGKSGRPSRNKAVQGKAIKEE